MVLDKMHNGKFVFKNTHEDNRQVEMAVGHKDAPDEFFFVHIKLELNRLDQIRQRFGLPQFPTPEEKVEADKRSIYVGQVFKSYFICLE